LPVKVGTDSMLRNVGENDQNTLRNMSDERRSDLNRDVSLKSRADDWFVQTFPQVACH